MYACALLLSAAVGDVSALSLSLLRHSSPLSSPLPLPGRRARSTRQIPPAPPIFGARLLAADSTPETDESERRDSGFPEREQHPLASLSLCPSVLLRPVPSCNLLVALLLLRRLAATNRPPRAPGPLAAIGDVPGRCARRWAAPPTSYASGRVTERGNTDSALPSPSHPRPPCV
jgi:hypothetical protein